MDDTQKLGGNIELSGFSSLDHGSQIVLRKIIGSYARKFSDKMNGIDLLKLAVSASEGNIEVQGGLEVKGASHSAKVTESNVFVAVDKALKELEKKLA